jgi:hypothetical protein
MHTFFLVPVLLMTHHHGFNDPIFLEPGAQDRKTGGHHLDDHAGEATLLLKKVFRASRWMLA